MVILESSTFYCFDRKALLFFARKRKERSATEKMWEREGKRTARQIEGAPRAENGYLKDEKIWKEYSTTKTTNKLQTKNHRARNETAEFDSEHHWTITRTLRKLCRTAPKRNDKYEQEEKAEPKTYGFRPLVILLVENCISSERLLLKKECTHSSAAFADVAFFTHWMYRGCSLYGGIRSLQNLKKKWLQKRRTKFNKLEKFKHYHATTAFCRQIAHNTEVSFD